jgi:hypothetical protein
MIAQRSAILLCLKIGRNQPTIRMSAHALGAQRK